MFFENVKCFPELFISFFNKIRAAHKRQIKKPAD